MNQRHLSNLFTELKTLFPGVSDLEQSHYAARMIFRFTAPFGVDEPTLCTAFGLPHGFLTAWGYRPDLEQGSENYQQVLDLLTKKSNSPVQTYKIRDEGPGGGIIFFVDSSGQHGFEADHSDISLGTWDRAMESCSHGWRLPSRKEMTTLYECKKVFDPIAYYPNSSTPKTYWTGDSFNGSTAYYMYAGDGIFKVLRKDYNHNFARAIKDF